ncbi:putative RNA-directed DNA polymerase [Tanacetum coccineum]|uniref:RNA-directed DNA polymerase n=1 Tax=Tanacetum coccineum TaxID=301880 RepID=A0ABQ5F916_9ASTR
MDFRSTPCVFLGYSPSHHGYRCLDIFTERLYIARHVRFNEAQFPFDISKTTSPPPSKTSPYYSSESPYVIPTDHPSPSSPRSPISSPSSVSHLSPTSQTSPESFNGQPFPVSTTSIPTPPPPTPPPPPSIIRQRPSNLRQNPKQRVPYNSSANHATVLPTTISEPTSFIIANNSPEWRQAMKEGLKRDKNGAITCYKARFVAKGFRQQPGIDFHETFSPVVKSTTIRAILSLAITNNWPLRQLDMEILKSRPHALGLSAFPRLSSISVSKAPKQIHLCLFIRVDTRFCTLWYMYMWMTSLLQKYILELLQSVGLSNCNPVSSPMVTSSSLSLDDSTAFSNPAKYRQVVGSLQYVTLSRPDIAFAVNKVCQYMLAPTENHWYAVKHILRYLHGTVEHGMPIRRSSGSTLQAFTDVLWKGNPDTSLEAFSADWAGDSDDRRSTGGFAIYLGSNLISWTARKQRTVSRSSREVEYKALADTVAELTWLQALLHELGICSSSTPILWCDNLGATYLSANPIFRARKKYVEIDYHFVREMVAQGDLRVQHISTHDQIADIFTKPLQTPRFLFLRSKLQCVALGHLVMLCCEGFESPRHSGGSHSIFHVLKEILRLCPIEMLVTLCKIPAYLLDRDATTRAKGNLWCKYRPCKDDTCTKGFPVETILALS